MPHLQQVPRGHWRIHTRTPSLAINIVCLSDPNPPLQAELVIIFRWLISTPAPPPQGWLRGRTSFSWPWVPLRATADPRNESIGQAVRQARLRLVSGDCSITESGMHTISIKQGQYARDGWMSAYCWKTFPAPNNLLTLASWP